MILTIVVDGTPKSIRVIYADFLLAGAHAIVQAAKELHGLDVDNVELESDRRKGTLMCCGVKVGHLKIQYEQADHLPKRAP